MKMDLDRVDDGQTTIDDTLFKSFRGFLILGKLVGILPYKGIFGNSSINLAFSWFSVSSIISYIIIFVLALNSVLECLLSASASKKNAYEIAQSVRAPLYNVWGTVIYLNFIFRSKSFLNIFKAWRSCHVQFTKPDVHLKRDAIIISVLILTSGILENAFLYIGYVERLVFPKNDPSDRNSTLQLYYIQSHPSWARYIPYNPFFAVVAFIQHKFILICWNYMDIFIALLGRAMYFKFKSLCESSDEYLVAPLHEDPRFKDNPKALQLPDTKGWIQMTKDHRALCDLLRTFENFLSPLIFISYAVNVYYICMQLLDGLTVDLHINSWSDAVNKPWSFIHLVMRIYILSICCARVNFYAHEIRNVLYECPAECYNLEVSRLDKRVSGGREIGFTGLNCFTCTTPFILSFIGVIFTFEIVLLQVIPTAAPSGETKCCCK